MKAGKLSVSASIASDEDDDDKAGEIIVGAHGGTARWR